MGNGNERLSLEIAATTVGEEGVNRLASAIEKVVDIGTRAGATGASAGKSIGEGFAHSIPSIAATSGAIRELEGAIPIRALERFITMFPAVQNFFQVGFPLVGIVAAGGAIFEAGKHLDALIQKFDPLAQAQKRAADNSKEFSAQIKSLGDEIEKLNEKGFERAFGKIPGLYNTATNQGRSVFRDSVNLDFLNLERARTQGNTGSLTGPGAGSNPIAAFMRSRFSAASQYDLRLGGDLSQHIDAAELTLARDRAAQADSFLGAMSGQRDQSNEDAKKSVDKFAEATKILTHYIEETSGFGIGPASKIIAEASGARESLAPYPTLLAQLNRSTQRRIGNEFNLGFNRSVGELLNPETLDIFNARSLEVGGKRATDDQRESDEADRKDREAQSRLNDLIRRGDAANFGQMRDSTNRQSRLLSIGGQPGDELAIARAQLEIRNQEVAAERLIINGHKEAYDLDVENARLTKESQDNTLEYMSVVKEYLAKQDEAYRNLSGGLLESAFGGGKSVSNFILGQLKHLGVDVFENVAKMVEPDVMKMIPHASAGSALGKVFQGTLFGPDPMKSALDLNTIATQQNTAALTGARNGTVGGGSTLPGGFSGLSSLPGFGALPPAELPSAPQGTWSYDPSSGSAVYLPATSSSAAPSGGNHAIPSALLAGVGAAAGGFAAYQGFSQGGARGALQGTAGVIGGASSILSMIPAVASAIPIVGAAIAAALPLVSSLLGDPRQQRGNQISKMLSEAVYNAPTAINETASTNGTYLSFDARGNLRTSNFSARPVVSEPYTYWGPNNTPYQAPGSVTSPFSAPQPTVVQHIYQAGAIQTMDAASFNEFAQKNHQAIGNAAARNLQSGPTLLAQRIQYVR